MLSKAVVVALALVVVPAAPDPAVVESYIGMCDASAGVALDPTHFVVANDEDSLLRVYRVGTPKQVAEYLPPDLKKPKPEADVEGAALIGDRIYWIASHAHNKTGEAKIKRRQLFATVVKHDGPGGVRVEQVGHSYAHLREDLIGASALAKYKLADAAKEGLAPEADGGFNIEGLAAAAETGGALIAFRNPVRGHRALVVPLLNPAELVDGDGAAGTARFGPAIELDLGEDRGIRSIEYIPSAKHYLIVAGPSGKDGTFVLYRWSGAPSDAPVAIKTPAAWSPLGVEALMLLPPASPAVPGAPTHLLVLSDDGDVKVTIKGTPVDCKEDAVPPEKKSFRALRWTAP